MSSYTWAWNIQLPALKSNFRLGSHTFHTQEDYVLSRWSNSSMYNHSVLLCSCDITIVYIIWTTATTVYSTNIWPSSLVIGGLPLISPSPFELGVYQWQASLDLGLGSYICGIHLLAVVYILHIYIYIYVLVRNWFGNQGEAKVSKVWRAEGVVPNWLRKWHCHSAVPNS